MKYQDYWKRHIDTKKGIAKEIVEDILDDLNDLCGIGDEFAQTHPISQYAIIDRWIEIVENRLAKQKSIPMKNVMYVYGKDPVQLLASPAGWVYNGNWQLSNIDQKKVRGKIIDPRDPYTQYNEIMQDIDSDKIKVLAI